MFICTLCRSDGCNPRSHRQSGPLHQDVRATSGRIDTAVEWASAEIMHADAWHVSTGGTLYQIISRLHAQNAGETCQGSLSLLRSSLNQWKGDYGNPKKPLRYFHQTVHFPTHIMRIGRVALVVLALTTVFAACTVAGRPLTGTRMLPKLVLCSLNHDCFEHSTVSYLGMQCFSQTPWAAACSIPTSS